VNVTNFAAAEKSWNWSGRWNWAGAVPPVGAGGRAGAGAIAGVGVETGAMNGAITGIGGTGTGAKINEYHEFYHPWREPAEELELERRL